MKTDAEKIKRIEEILNAQNIAETFEAVSLALSVEDGEERDLHLFYTIKWLLAGKIWQKSYGIAQMMSPGYEKCESLRIIAEHLISIGHLEKAFLIFDEAEKEIFGDNLSEWQKAELLHHISKALYQAKAIFKAEEVREKAVAVARKGEESSDAQNSSDSSSVLAEIAEHLAFSERTETALSIARKIKNIGKKERALQQISLRAQQIKQIA